MILTVTINPLLERRYKFSKIKINNENRQGKNEIRAGGKGINVSRQLNLLNCDNLALTFLGGSNGRILKDILIKENIKVTSIRTQSATRDCSLIFEESSGEITTFFGENSIISDAEVEEFKFKMDKMIQNCEIVVFSGSSPCSQTDTIFPFGIEAANKYDKISVLDTYGNHLIKCLRSSPTIVHNNFQEVNNSLNNSLKSEKEVIEYLNSLYTMGIKQIFLTQGSDPVYAANFNFYYKVVPPKIKAIDPTGSGDSFTAGIVSGLEKDLNFEENIITAISLGALNAASYNVCSVYPSDIDLVRNQITIESIGKKMKTIDVIPN